MVMLSYSLDQVFHQWQGNRMEIIFARQRHFHINYSKNVDLKKVIMLTIWDRLLRYLELRKAHCLCLDLLKMSLLQQVYLTSRNS